MITSYTLRVLKDEETGLYDIYESHCGDGKGCFETMPEYLDGLLTIPEAQEFIKDFKSNLLEGAERFEGVIWSDFE